MEIKPARPTRGRPREFDRDAALSKALTLFWARGYEGTSVADLVAAMGITPPSLYAAFGSKDALYRAAIALYLRGPGRLVARALEEEPTARGAVERILREATRMFTAKTHPPGCMVSTAALACAPEHREVADGVAALRAATIEGVTKRIKRAQRDGELSPSVRASDLARFYGAIVQGMSVQAQDGASAAELAGIARMALGAWPGASTHAGHRHASASSGRGGGPATQAQR